MRHVAVVAVDEGQWPVRIGRLLAGSTSGSGDVRLFEPNRDLNRRLREYAPDLVISSPLGAGGLTADHLPDEMDVALISTNQLEDINTIAVLGSGGPYDVLKISIAAKIAQTEDAALRFVHVLNPSTSRAQIRSLESFHADLAGLFEVATESMVVESEDLISALTEAVADADLAVIGSSRGHHLFTGLIDRIVDRMSIPVLLVRVAQRGQRNTVRQIIDQVLSQSLARGRAERG
jgi:hypothetical protein